MSAGRRFGTSQRAALYLAADGKCSSCEADLQPGWHADHIHPHSKGGATDVVNGQALCPACNLRKGSRTSMTPPLSQWQQDALRKFSGHDSDFLAVACPGAGKTRFALAAAQHQIQERGASRIVVVVPTRHLCEQWKQHASKFGIQLDPEFKNGKGGAASDYDGVVVTYASVASEPNIYRRMATPRSLVIFDEVHHAGDDASWGKAMRHAFDDAGRRLLLSGTPKRTDGTEVPYVTYDDEGAFVEDYLYDYGRALEDHRVDDDGNSFPVVRPTDFNVFDGRARWLTATDAEVRMNLSDAGDAEMSNALSSALDPGGDWIPSTLTAANDALTAARREVADAGGLVVADSQFQARKYAATLERITGESVALAISDAPDASNTITNFDKGRSRWIVAVQMVSEGVDIPRLSVCVYATRKRTELFFRQVVGRIVRCQGVDDSKRATMFIPSVEPLVRFASEIERTTRMALEAKEAREQADREMGERINPTILGAEAALHTGTISHGTQFTADEIAFAQTLINSHGLPVDTHPATMAQIVRSLRGGQGGEASGPQEVPDLPLAERKKQAKADLKDLVGKVAYHCYGGRDRAGDVRYDLKKVTGYGIDNSTSLEQIERHVAIASRCLREGRQVA